MLQHIVLTVNDSEEFMYKNMIEAQEYPKGTQKKVLHAFESKRN